MAEKIYLVDVHPGPKAPAGPRAASRPAGPSQSAPPSRAVLPVRSEAPARQDRDDLGMIPLGARAVRPEPVRVPQVDEEIPESWIRHPSPPAARRPFRPVRVLVALYTLGGIAPLALGIGPRQFMWAAFAAVSLTTWVTLAWFRGPLEAMMASARLPILPFLVGLFLAHAAGALSWARALARTIQEPRFRPEELPRWLRDPWLAGSLGFVLPGFGHAVTGRARRAGFALWNAASVVLAATVLAHVSVLWTWNRRSGADSLPGTFLEALLVACGAAVAVGGLLWIGGALDGARLAANARARWLRHGRASAPGDAVAGALVLALVLFAATFRPGQMAHDLDCFGGALRFSGCRLVPLGFESAAVALDPSRPEYAMRVAELHTEMGHPEKAQAIHDRLRERWEVYAQLVLQTAAAGHTPPPARPIQPGQDLAPRTPPLAPNPGQEPPAARAVP